MLTQVPNDGELKIYDVEGDVEKSSCNEVTCEEDVTSCVSVKDTRLSLHSDVN